MRKRVIGLALAFALTGVFSQVPAGAAGPAIVAGPGAQTAGFATPAMAVPEGGELMFASADIVLHNVESTAIGPDTQSWCVLFLPGSCPLFWSEYISVGTTVVLGLENAVPGTIYDFYCAPHATSMRGKLVVLPNA